MTSTFFALIVLILLAVSSAQPSTVQMPPAPATVDTSVEKAAWEALMSPVGEYAAYATYDAILKKYGNVEPYATVLGSEQRHINALTRQLQRYGVTVPANPYLGKITLAADLKAIASDEAQGERDNVAMYDKLMPQANGDAQLQRVFTNLRGASRDIHLVLFKKAAATNGTLTAADMTNFHNLNMNGMSMNGQGQNNLGQRLDPQNQSGRDQTFNQQLNRGHGTMQGMGRGQMMGGQMKAGDCPMMNGQGQRRGPGRHR